MFEGSDSLRNYENRGWSIAKRYTAGALLLTAGFAADRLLLTKETVSTVVEKTRLEGQNALLTEQIAQLKNETFALARFRKNVGSSLEPVTIKGKLNSCMPEEDFRDQTDLVETNLTINSLMYNRPEPKAVTPQTKAANPK